MRWRTVSPVGDLKGQTVSQTRTIGRSNGWQKHVQLRVAIVLMYFTKRASRQCVDFDICKSAGLNYSEQER